MHFEGKIYEDVKKKKKKITPTLNTTMRSKYIKTAIFKELESVKSLVNLWCSLIKLYSENLQTSIRKIKPFR